MQQASVWASIHPAQDPNTPDTKHSTAPSPPPLTPPAGPPSPAFPQARHAFETAALPDTCCVGAINLASHACMHHGTAQHSTSQRRAARLQDQQHTCHAEPRSTPELQETHTHTYTYTIHTQGGVLIHTVDSHSRLPPSTTNCLNTQHAGSNTCAGSTCALAVCAALY